MSRSSAAADERRQAQLLQDLSRGVRRTLPDALLALADSAPDESVAMTVVRAAVPTAPARLARHHPGGAPAQAQARALYERCLAHDRALAGADRHDAEADDAEAEDDAAAVLARFVAASLGALRDVDVTPAMLERLARQMARILAVSPVWRRAALAERQSAVEQFAILGVLVRESAAQALLQGPAALANVRRAARGYLLQLLGLDAERLTLTERGLAFADAAAVPVPAAA